MARTLDHNEFVQVCFHCNEAFIFTIDDIYHDIHRYDGARNRELQGWNECPHCGEIDIANICNTRPNEKRHLTMNICTEGEDPFVKFKGHVVDFKGLLPERGHLKDYIIG